MAGDAPTPPSRPPHCEDPPVPPSVRGSPLTDGGTGGRPPGDGICQSRRWPVSGQDAGPGRQRAGSPTRSLPRGNGPHPGHIRPASQSPWGPVRGTGSSARHPEVRSFSRGPHLPARLPPRQRQSAREELGTRGLDQVRARVPRLVGRGPGGPDPRPGTPSPGGASGLRPAWGAKSLSWLRRPHPAPRRQTCTETHLLSKVWAGLPEKGLCPLGPGSHRARTPLPVKASAACGPWCPQKAFTCGEPGPR